MKKIVNSPLRILGLLTILIGLLTAILTYGYLIVLGLIFIGVGLLVYVIDYLTFKFLINKRAFWVSQVAMSILYVMLAFVTYMKWREHNYIIFPTQFKGQAGIIFGIEGYPELPKTKFWKKIINIPDDGILITSTKVEDIPHSVRYALADNSQIDHQDISWDPNFEMDCIVSDSKIKGWLFEVGKGSSTVKDVATSLCNEISASRKKSFYKSENSVVWTDNKGKYLWLHGRGLTSLPNGLEKLNIYKAILTGNNLKEVPLKILEIKDLEELILAVNPIDEFPCSISRLRSLKSISFAETQIKEIDCDLSQLDSLEHFDISRNGLMKFPEQIKAIPNLTWLSLNDNQLMDISFIDERLNKLETLFLYTNKVKKMSEETRHLNRLRELLIFDNEIDSIPDNISDLRNLENLEIWDNPIEYISPKISGLKKLKSMRLDDDYLTQRDKDNLRKWLPNCEITYQTRKEKKSVQ